MPPATAIAKDDIEQTKNISFLGAIHYGGAKINSLIGSHKYENELFSIQQEYLNNHSYDFLGLFKKHFGDKFEALNLESIDLYPFFNYRWLTLASLLDLGLCISGLRWDEVIKNMPQLAAAYFKESIWSLKENADFYNSSKISISLSRKEFV